MSLNPIRNTSVRRVLPAAVALSVAAAVLSTPTVASAVYTQYAQHRATPESTARYSATATVRGGQAYTDSGLMRTYIQTVSGGVLLASAYGPDGQSVNLAHTPYSGAQSRCYWDYVGGTVAGNPSLGLNCWRLS